MYNLFLIQTVCANVATTHIYIYTHSVCVSIYNCIQNYKDITIDFVWQYLLSKLKKDGEITSFKFCVLGVKAGENKGGICGNLWCDFFKLWPILFELIVDDWEKVSMINLSFWGVFWSCSKCSPYRIQTIQ